MDGERLLESVAIIDEDLPVVGGLRRRSSAAAAPTSCSTIRSTKTASSVSPSAAPTRCKTVVSQGAAPIGETWTITGVEGNVIETIGMRPALEVLYETFRALPPETQERARTNLLVGLAMNEYRDEFGRGDFLIRNLVGVDQQRQARSPSAPCRAIGQTLQFQLRDPAAADEELERAARPGAPAS